MQIGVIGGGPRGLAVMERILARFSKKHLQKRKKLSVAWFEDTVFGGGRIWNPYQTNALLMNTVASQLSAFPDESTGLQDGYLTGPTFIKWLESLASQDFLRDDPALLAEAKNVKPNGYTSRVLYGAYLCWAAQCLINKYRLEEVDIHLIRERVESLERNSRRFLLQTNFGLTSEEK